MDVLKADGLEKRLISRLDSRPDYGTARKAIIWRSDSLRFVVVKVAGEGVGEGRRPTAFYLYDLEAPPESRSVESWRGRWNAQRRAEAAAASLRAEMKGAGVGGVLVPAKNDGGPRPADSRLVLAASVVAAGPDGALREVLNVFAWTGRTGAGRVVFASVSGTEARAGETRTGAGRAEGGRVAAAIDQAIKAAGVRLAPVQGLDNALKAVARALGHEGELLAVVHK